MSEEILQLWGSWEPTIKGDSGKFTIGLAQTAQVTFEDITIEDYIKFINDLQNDLITSKKLLVRMGVLKEGVKRND